MAAMTTVPWQHSLLFAALAPHHLQALGRIVVLREVARGEFLFHEGEPCAGCFVLLEGAITLRRFAGDEGREVPLHALAPGQSFAEAALFAGMAFPATAQAEAPSRVAFFPGPALLARLREDPDLALALLASQARWLQRLVGRLAQLGTQDAAGRLRAWLREAAQGRSEVRIPGTKKALAGQLGMSPETLSRSLADLRDQGLLEVRGPLLRLKGRP